MSLGGWLCNTESIQQSVWDGMIGRRAAAAIREVQALRDLSVLSHHTHSKGFSAAVTPPGWGWGAGLIERKARKLKALSPSAAQAAWNEQPIYIVLSPSGPCNRQSFLHSHLKSGNTTEQKLSMATESWLHPSRTGPRNPNTTKPILNPQGSGLQIIIIFCLSCALAWPNMGSARDFYPVFIPALPKKKNSLKRLVVLSSN